MIRRWALFLTLLPGVVMAQDPVLAPEAGFDPEAGFAIVTALDPAHVVVRNGDADFVCTLIAARRLATLSDCMPVGYVGTAPLTVETVAALTDDDISTLVVEVIVAQGCVLDISDRKDVEQLLVTEVARRLGETGRIPLNVFEALMRRIDTASQINLQDRVAVDPDARTVTLLDC
jgi:hypothetical protein